MNNITSTRRFLNESDEPVEGYTGEEVDKVVFDVWKKHMPKSAIWRYKGGLAPNYLIYTATIGKDKSEYSNGIRHNDPLNLSFTIDITVPRVAIVWDASSLMIVPENPAYAFDSKKLKFRKTKVKDIKDIGTKLDKFFGIVKKEIQNSLKNGDFDVHSDATQKMIKTKV